MAIGINGKEKPVYAEGQKVAFDIDGTVRGQGRIRGRVSEHLIDIWIVEIMFAANIDPALYPWSCIAVPHTLLEACD